MTRMTQMTHTQLDTPVSQLSDYAIMALKMELLRKVKELADEMAHREVAQDSTGVFTSW